jgi:hypothetical protein
MDLEEALFEISYLELNCREVGDALQTAGTVENLKDFIANLKDAKKALAELESNIDNLISECGANPDTSED